MPHLERHLARERLGGGAIQPMEILDRELHSMSLDGCVTLDDIENVLLHILLHHIPRTATQAKSLALSDGVEPMAFVLPDLLAQNRKNIMY